MAEDFDLSDNPVPYIIDKLIEESNNVSPSYSESFIIDLNIGDDKLSDAALVELKSEILVNYEIDDLEVGDDFDLEL
jgi:hypothetical protein